MSQDSFDYPHLVQIALRGLVRNVLRQVEEHGLPGVHHFYITYDTRHPDVVLSAELRSRYPESITIVLQHDYRELVVEDDRFSVILHFSGMPQRIRVPFDALVTFYDPSEEFALQFEPQLPKTGPVAVAEDTSKPEAKPGSLAIPVRAVLEAADRMQAEKDAASPDEPDGEPKPAVEAAFALRSQAQEAVADDDAAPPEKVSPVPAAAAAPSDASRSSDADTDEAEAGEKPSNVVSIDAFRKK